MTVLAIILSLAAFAGLTGATYQIRGPLPPLNTFVTCYDPFELSNGFYFPIERRPPPLIPLQETPQENFPTTQFQFPGNVWIPVPSGWDAPPGKLSESQALIHLGDSFNQELTANYLPTGDLTVGSLPGYQPSPLVVPGDIPDTPANALDVIEEYFVLNGLGDSGCNLVGEWVYLGPNYYPSYLATFYCQESMCSFANGTGCHPDLTRSDAPTSPYLVTMLRWDCCQSFNPALTSPFNPFGGFEYLCGWMKVQVPIIRSCLCRCGPRLS